MKKLLILILICLGAWQYSLKNSETVEPNKSSAAVKFSNSAAIQTLSKAKEIAKPKSRFKCDGRQHCSQMRSYEEAKYFIRHCPNTKMDGDNDGIPCERQFNRYD
ncbi:excalibur calcium-binding domain-containing protein [Thalassotalea crassostreae]|uniref:excalibur calcium-binding domain-containing protein n=1 Tax=Thalassotalea crassostreae TaxID=1763536 RepID=UPI0008380A25|nr:excalibur calcium-binding domain-containing protein [Thalassotalea crassostreae]